MIHRSLSYDPTPEHRLTRAKWVRGFAIVYGTTLLLLALLAAQRVTFEHDRATANANSAAAHPLRADLRASVAMRSPSVPPAAKSSSHVSRD